MDSNGSSHAYVIETQDVWRVYMVGGQEVRALRGVSLQVKPGTFTAVKGRSGSGKTTLLNCIGGLDRPTSGDVIVHGQDLLGMSNEDLTRWRRRQVGFIFQSFGLLPILSAYENVELMLRIAGVAGRERRERADRSLGLVGLGQWSQHRPYEMSGGQQQRVAIARALVNNPELLLADEPTGELDSTTSREILGLFRQIVDEEHMTLMVVSHDMLVDDYADEILELSDGQIVDRVLHR
ncbi:MAG: ABC transporter ATP-binding protein [Anaerolineae bacterium]|nr:ABC transporter ATP-binding protein [Anaerolineae bacterium]